MNLPELEVEIIPFEYPEQGGDVSVTNIVYDLCTLRVTLKCSEAMGRLYVEFSGVRGIRVLDEADIHGFWGARSNRRALRNGDVCLIKAGGWFDLESNREDFLRKYEPCKEYLIVGLNTCVGVFAHGSPVFDSHLGPTDSQIRKVFDLEA